MKMVKLSSSDNVSFEVELKVAKQLGVISDALDFCGDVDSVDSESPPDVQDSPKAVTEQDAIPIMNVNGRTLAKVLEWAEHHKNDLPHEENPDASAKASSDEAEIMAWDKAFLEIDQAELFDLMMAANYLDVKGLLDICARFVANMIKGKTPEEMRTMFNITNDFTPVEEQQCRSENDWIEERDA